MHRFFRALVLFAALHAQAALAADDPCDVSTLSGQELPIFEAARSKPILEMLTWRINGLEDFLRKNPPAYYERATNNLVYRADDPYPVPMRIQKFSELRSSISQRSDPVTRTSQLIQAANALSEEFSIGVSYHKGKGQTGEFLERRINYLKKEFQPNVASVRFWSPELCRQ